jgi:glucosylceramidase
VEGCGRIYGLNGNCVDLAGNGQSDFNGVDLWPCWSGDPAQLWAWRYTSGEQIQGVIALVENPGLCLGTVGGSQTEGTPVDIYACNGTDAENWSYDSGTKEIINASSGMCLDVTNGQDQGVQLQIWDCVDNYNQQFNFVLSAN